MKRRPFSLLIFAILVVGVGFAACAGTRPASADTSDVLPSWVDTSPEIKKQHELAADEFTLATANPHCKPQVVHEWGYNPGFGPKLDYLRDGCLVEMADGYYDTAGKGFVAFGSDSLQRLKDPLGDAMSQIVVLPATGTGHLAMVYDSYYPFSNGGAKLKLVDNWTQKFPPTLSADGYSNIERIRTMPYDYELKDSSGNYVEIRTQGLVFSSNGDWLQVLLRDKSHAVLNVTTHDIMPYSGPDESDRAVRDAVSNDGRYVAITHSQDSFKIYDLSQCGAPAGEFVSRNCRSIELFDRIRNFIGAGAQITIGDVQFVGIGDAMDVNVGSSTDGTSWQYATYHLSIPGRISTKYLALGDSFSSGEGAFDYVEATDRFVSNDEYNVCHLSRKSYPYLLQQNLQADWFYSVACSGSDSKDLIYAGSIDNYIVRGNPKAKFKLQGENDVEKAAFALQASSFYISNMRPGYIPQLSFANKENPNIVTISIGGNDVGFEEMVSSCVFKGATINQTCFSDREERESKANEIDQKISTWSKNFVDIKNSLSGSDPKLYVIGYPKIVSTDLRYRCGLNVPFDDAERLLADRMIDYLNAAVKVAADAAGVRYVDASDSLTRGGEHRLCGSGSAFAVNGLDLRQLINECTSAAVPNAKACPNSFHPNALGQKLMADTILAKTANLTQAMPENSNSTANLIDKRMDFVGDVAITLQDHRITFQKDIAPLLIAKGETFHVNVPKSDDDLPAQQGSSATVTAHSTPLTLGQLPITADGTISGDITLPANLETGYHRLVVSYTDIAGNIVEKYMYFFAANSANDWDGDGVDNASDPCSIVPQSDIDQDEDGIDDACDGEYVKAAQTSTPIQNSGKADDRPTSAASRLKVDDTVDKVNLDGLKNDGISDIFTSPAIITPLHPLQAPAASDAAVTQATGDDVAAPSLLLPLSVIAGILLLVLAPFVFRKRRV